MKKIRPRVRYFGGLLTLASFLVFSGAFFHYLSNRRQRRNLEIRIEALASRVSTLESRPAVSSSSSSVSVSGSAAAPESSPEPRIRSIGRGSSGNWVYSDIRMPNGLVRRYYLRKNATPAEALTLLRNIRLDIEEYTFPLAPSEPIEYD